jgi:hypothetical protein
MGGTCGTYGRQERCVQGFSIEAWGKRPLGRRRCKWEDNFKMGLQEVGWGGMDWIDMAQDRDRWRAVVNAVMNIRVLSNSGKFLTSWGPICFSGRTVLDGVSYYGLDINFCLFSLREENGLELSEIIALSRLCRRKSDERGEWTKLLNLLERDSV